MTNRNSAQNKAIIAMMVGASFLVKNAGDNCLTSQQDNSFFVNQEPSGVDFNCYVDSFSPEDPETKSPYSMPYTPTTYSVAASGVSNSIVTLPMKYSISNSDR